MTAIHSIFPASPAEPFTPGCDREASASCADLEGLRLAKSYILRAQEIIAGMKMPAVKEAAEDAVSENVMQDLECIIDLLEEGLDTGFQLDRLYASDHDRQERYIQEGKAHLGLLAALREVGE